MDPLSLLRDYTIRKQLDSVVTAGNVCKFGDEYEFTVDIPTAYKARTGYGENGYYTLEMLVVYIKSSNLRHTEYMGAVNRKQHVAFVDRKDLKVRHSHGSRLLQRFMVMVTITISGTVT